MDLRKKKYNSKTVDKTILHLTEEHLKDGKTILLDICDVLESPSSKLYSEWTCNGM